jgi:hypothetical protein
MSHDSAPKFGLYFGQAWVILSIVLGLVLLGMFVFGPALMHVGYVVWSLIRWLFSPII